MPLLYPNRPLWQIVKRLNTMFAGGSSGQKMVKRSDDDGDWDWEDDEGSSASKAYFISG